MGVVQPKEHLLCSLYGQENLDLQVLSRGPFQIGDDMAYLQVTLFANEQQHILQVTCSKRNTAHGYCDNALGLCYARCLFGEIGKMLGWFGWLACTSRGPFPLEPI